MCGGSSSLIHWRASNKARGMLFTACTHTLPHHTQLQHTKQLSTWIVISNCLLVTADLVHTKYRAHSTLDPGPTSSMQWSIPTPTHTPVWTLHTPRRSPAAALAPAHFPSAHSPGLSADGNTRQDHFQPAGLLHQVTGTGTCLSLQLQSLLSSGGFTTPGGRGATHQEGGELQQCSMGTVTHLRICSTSRSLSCALYLLAATTLKVATAGGKQRHTHEHPPPR